MQALEDDMRENPAEALSELDALVRRMLEETGYDLTIRSRARATSARSSRSTSRRTRSRRPPSAGSDEISPGDIAAAINGYRAVYDYLVANRCRRLDADITLQRRS